MADVNAPGAPEGVANATSNAAPAAAAPPRAGISEFLRQRVAPMCVFALTLAALMALLAAAVVDSEDAAKTKPVQPAASLQPDAPWVELQNLIAAAGKGPVFPSRFSESDKFSGSWSGCLGELGVDASGAPCMPVCESSESTHTHTRRRTGNATDAPERDAADSALACVSPQLAENVTVAYGVSPSAHGPSSSGLRTSVGGAQLVLGGTPVGGGDADGDGASRLQRVTGAMLMKDADGAQAVRVTLHGIYFADEGLLTAVGTTEDRLGVVAVVPNGDVLAARGLQDVPQASPMPQASQSPQPKEFGTCDIVLALRFRPIGYDGGAAAGNGTRQLSSMDVSSLLPVTSVLPLAGQAVSLNCNFTVNITVSAVIIDREVIRDKALWYSLGAVALSCATVALTVQQIMATSSSGAFRMSMLTVGMQAVMDAYLSLAHIMGALLATNVFVLFAMASFINMVTFSLIQMRLLVMIWKARFPESFMGAWESVRRAITHLYGRFYLAVIAGLLIVYFGQGYSVEFVTFVLMSFWLPQIVHSVQHDSRPGLTPRFIIGISIARWVIPAYVFMCPYSLLYAITPAESTDAARSWAMRLMGPTWLVQPVPSSLQRPPYPWLSRTGNAPAFASAELAQDYASSLRFGLVFTAWLALQAGVMLLQARPDYGPRFFVPGVFLPRKYDYHRTVVIDSGRVVPNAAETRAFLQGRASTASASDAAPPPDPNASRVQELARYSRVWLARTRAHLLASAEYSRDTAVWFVDCCRLLVLDWSVRTRRWWKRTARVGGVGGYTRIDRAGVDGATAPSDDASAVDVETTDPVQAYLNEIVSGDREDPHIDANGELAALAPSAAASANAAADAAAAPHRHSIDCVVCMDSVTFPTQRKNYMVTPCDHVFHTMCLAPWLQQKVECPTCRMQLPEP